MRGHKRFHLGAWRLTVEAPNDPVTGKRRQVHRTVHASNNREGARQADIELAKLVLEVEAQRTVPRSGLTVADLLERYVVARTHKWSPSEPEGARTRAREHINPNIGHIAADKLRPVDVTQLYTALREKGLSEGTVSRIHILLHAALNWAWKHDLIPSNPAGKADKPTQGKGRREAVSDEVLIALLKAATEVLDLLCYLRLAAVTGARRGQLVALRWSDFNLEDGSVLFTRAHIAIKGAVIEKSTKGEVDYGVALDLNTVELLKAHRKQCVERALATGVGLPDDAYVFAQRTAPDGSKAWYPNGANERFNKLREKVSGAEKVTPHQFRHWMATAMFEDGFDPITVTGRGGWATPALPMSRYGHFRPVRDQAAAVSLAKRLDDAEASS